MAVLQVLLASEFVALSSKVVSTITDDNCSHRQHVAAGSCIHCTGCSSNVAQVAVSHDRCRLRPSVPTCAMATCVGGGPACTQPVRLLPAQQPVHSGHMDAAAGVAAGNADDDGSIDVDAGRNVVAVDGAAVRDRTAGTADIGCTYAAGDGCRDKTCC